jgi:hypothetical protein
MIVKTVVTCLVLKVIGSYVTMEFGTSHVDILCMTKEGN